VLLLLWVCHILEAIHHHHTELARVMWLLVAKLSAQGQMPWEQVGVVCTPWDRGKQQQQ